RNTLVAGSPLGGDCLSSGTIGENIHNLVQDGSCSPLLTGDPRLGPMADNGGPTETHALQPDSPAIDMGDPATCLANDQRSEARDDWACDIGAFELKHPDSDTVVKAIGGPGVYTFGPTKVKVQVVTQGGLTGLTIRKVVGNHAGRTGSGGSGGGVGWGEWFVLTPNSGANGTFQAALTLPALFTPNANDKVCRYLGGALWDCAGHGFGLAPFPHITRQGVSAFSDWAAGDEVGPNAVTVREFRAAPWTCVQQLRGLWRR
ncbi:MAG: choice-of-anchor Q domain-containing protein, partial [Anaerolineae bacterium]|nr:choice-of-anchor Q domain-containing protein [Anaerolineae bacterium]